MRRAFQSRPPPPRQLNVEGVEVDVAHALKELGALAVGQGLGATGSAKPVLDTCWVRMLADGRRPTVRLRWRLGRPPLKSRYQVMPLFEINRPKNRFLGMLLARAR